MRHGDRNAEHALADFEPSTLHFREAVLEGLSHEPKSIPSKFLYDERGSRLFDQICALDEYYPTRTEAEILRANRDEIAQRIGPGGLLIEYGSGSSEKTPILLDRLRDLAAYVPIDISREHLLQSAERLQRAYPDLEVLPVCADYTGDYALPVPRRPVARRVVFFPGSTIGNLEPEPAREFLAHAAEVCGRGGGLLIGVDLHKDSEILQAAYDDSQGVSAAFALNVLERMNRELGADFDLDRFAYDAFYDVKEKRIDMAVRSLADQTVHVAGRAVKLEEGERIRTEYSYKFTLEGFAALAEKAGFTVSRVWTDPRALFSVQYLTAL